MYYFYYYFYALKRINNLFKQIEQYFSVLGSVGMGTRILSGWIVLGQLNKAFQLCNIWWNFKVEHIEGAAEESNIAKIEDKN